MKLLGDNPHQLVGLIGLVMSAGKCAYGITAMKFGENLSKMVIIGMISHTIGTFELTEYHYNKKNLKVKRTKAFYISLLYIPTEAILHDTWKIAYLPPNLTLLCIAAFLFGVGDVCLYTTGFALLGKVFRGRTCATAVAIFNFILLLFTGIHFTASSFISMDIQIFVIVIMLVLATLGVFKVDILIHETVDTTVQTSVASDED